jgi:hypothetical protein
MASALWRRLDTSGQDACRLDPHGDGWRLAGTAVFAEGGVPASLAYEVVCDGQWRARHGRATGFVGARSLDVRFERTSEGFRLDGAVVPGLSDCLDLDFGFTPATNLPALRRLSLEVGQSAEAPAAWFDAGAHELKRLPQRYERRSADTYWYESPTAGYAALLEFGPSGFVVRYPDLWEAVVPDGP